MRQVYTYIHNACMYVCMYVCIYVAYEGKELLNYYREDPSVKHIKPYTDLIYDAPAYPLFVDSNDVVLSLPPIINGKHSRITLATTNVFIECTATDMYVP